MSTPNEFLTLDQIKERLVLILDYFVSICEKHNLVYFLTDGTLLGAIRHKGFIPWDDDIDVSMPRPDYDKFIEIIKSEPNDIFMTLVPGDKDYPYDFAKIVDTRTALYEDEVMDIPNMGLWIDVLPLDGIKTPNGLHVKLLNYINLARAAATYKVCPKKRSNMYIRWWICHIVGFEFFLKLFLKLSVMYKYGEAPYVGWTEIAFRALYPKHVFEKTTLVEFEGKQYKAPAAWDEYLRLQYKDYMQLPPVSKRIAHHVRAFIK